MKKPPFTSFCPMKSHKKDQILSSKEETYQLFLLENLSDFEPIYFCGADDDNNGGDYSSYHYADILPEPHAV